MVEVKAKILLQNTVVELEGSPEAVSATIREIEAKTPEPPRGRRSLKPVLEKLASGGFFSTPRTMAEIKSALAEKQAVYKATSLFPVLYKEFLKPGRLVHEGRRGSFRYYLNEAASK